MAYYAHYDALGVYPPTMQAHRRIQRKRLERKRDALRAELARVEAQLAALREPAARQLPLFARD